jgi:O-antigen ligase
LTVPTFPLARAFDPVRRQRNADALMIATAVSLPWSTTATGILVALWLVALIATFPGADLRRLVLTPAGGLPVLLILLGAAGMLWADVSWAERWEGLVSFSKLLAIPLLFVQFSRSERGQGVFAAYLAACLALLLASFLLVLWPSLPHTAPDYGVMVKNAPSQSGEFVICIAGLLYIAHEAFGRRSYGLAAAAVAAMLAMLADIVFVANGRTALVMLLVLLLVFALTRLSLRSAVIFVGAAAALVVVAWLSSSYLRARVEQIWTEAQAYERTDVRNSSGERIEFAKKSLAFIREAPLIGHGTGSIHAQFESAAAGHTGAQGVASANPHNQTFAVGIQLGLLGMAVLWAMWIAHLLLFRGAGLAAWVGLLIVVQNVVGSVFNSHLFDFLQGWTYVVGVGVAGGMVLRARSGKSA